MRILLIAYEFPPGPSPQSLRWSRLARELVRHEAKVLVLTVRRDGERVRLPLPEGLVVERTPPGAASGLVAHLQSRHVSESTASPETMVAGPRPVDTALAPAPDSMLNWKGRLVARLDRVVGAFTFPDAFGQWEVAARLRLRQLLEEFRPDVVISSHEPATTLRLGRMARELGFAWLADLGDPVLSTYTPARWRWRARRVEAWTCRNAGHVTVTTATTKAMLAARHGVDATRFSVLPQGYDSLETAAAPAASPVSFDAGTLELVYTGSFYAFRHPRALVEAVLECEGVRLTVATRTPPAWLHEVSAAYPDKLRLTGFLTHPQALALQRGSDILVNIANDDEVQVPGKLFEYIGATRPILHIGGGADVAAMLHGRRRGIVAADRTDAVVETLRQLLQFKRDGDLATRFDLRPGLFPEYEWTDIGRRLFEIVRGLAKSS
ncbi:MULTISPECIES: glycosyltransferase [unclassified Luteimonas]